MSEKEVVLVLETGENQLPLSKGTIGALYANAISATRVVCTILGRRRDFRNYVHVYDYVNLVHNTSSSGYVVHCAGQSTSPLSMRRRRLLAN